MFVRSRCQFDNDLYESLIYAMKNIFLIIILILSSMTMPAQIEITSDIIMTADYGSENPEMRDLLQFQGVEYHKLSFKGEKLKNASFHLKVKEIWNGIVRSDSTIINSASIEFEQFQKINDSIFNLKIISKLTNEDQLKMTFKFPSFSVTKKFEAIKSDDYSLRNVAQASDTKIQLGKKFYLLAYILPYEKEGAKYWCAVESSGTDIENWGKEFGIVHYLVFEMIFE